MRDDEFAIWLEQRYVTKQGGRLGERPRSDARSRCKRVERYEGNLDTHFATDRLQALLDSLAYSRGDADRGVGPGHRVPIDGDAVSGTASLRSAVSLYRQFCEISPPGRAPR